MDTKKIMQMAAQIAAASETVTVAGEHNRAQLSGIYHTAMEIAAEMEKEEKHGG